MSAASSEDRFWIWIVAIVAAFYLGGKILDVVGDRAARQAEVECAKAEKYPGACAKMKCFEEAGSETEKATCARMP